MRSFIAIMIIVDKMDNAIMKIHSKNLLLIPFSQIIMRLYRYTWDNVVTFAKSQIQRKRKWVCVMVDKVNFIYFI